MDMLVYTRTILEYIMYIVEKGRASQRFSKVKTQY